MQLQTGQTHAYAGRIKCIHKRPYHARHYLMNCRMVRKPRSPVFGRLETDLASVLAGQQRLEVGQQRLEAQLNGLFEKIDRVHSAEADNRVMPFDDNPAVCLICCMPSSAVACTAPHTCRHACANGHARGHACGHSRTATHADAYAHVHTCMSGRRMRSKRFPIVRRHSSIESAVRTYCLKNTRERSSTPCCQDCNG